MPAIEINENTFSKVRTWVHSKRELAFFYPLIMSTRIYFKDEEYMRGRFGVDGATLTDANDIFLGNKFLTSITGGQIVYMTLNLLLQIAHLHVHRIKPLVDEDTTPFKTIPIDVRAACASFAASLWANEELAGTEILSNYYEVMEGCEHVMATINKSNYWRILGWEEYIDVPTPIKDIDTLLSKSTVERLASLFIQFHNPNNPPKVPRPLWGEANDEEKKGRNSEALKAHAKLLAKKAAAEAKKASKSGSNSKVFSPFSVDDLHLIQATRVNYKSYLDRMLVNSYSEWQGFDRRDLNNIDYTYTMNNEEFSCVVYADTSGSLVGNIKDVLAEVWGITKISNSKVRLKYFSSNIEQQDDPIYLSNTTDISQFNLPTTTGGTNWEPIKEDVENNHRDNNIIIITDGAFFDTPTPINTNKDVLIVLTKNYYDGYSWDDLGMLVGYSDIPD